MRNPVHDVVADQSTVGVVGAGAGLVRSMTLITTAAIANITAAAVITHTIRLCRGCGGAVHGGWAGGGENISLYHQFAIVDLWFGPLARAAGGDGITSTYWNGVYYLLEAEGFECWLVNAREVKNVPGRAKTDRADAVWLAKVSSGACAGPRWCTRPRSVGCAI